MPERKRTIEFFWINTPIERIQSCCDTLNHMPCSFSVTPNRFMEIGVGVDLYLSMRFHSDLDKLPICGTICYTRRSNLPHIDREGQEVTITLAQNDNGLLEKAHFLMTEQKVSGQKGTLVVLERFRFAPGFQNLYQYLKEKCGLDSLVLYKFYKNDILKDAANAQACRMIELDILPVSDISIIEQEYPTVGGMMKACMETGAKRLHIKIQTEKPRESLKKNIWQEIINIIKDRKEKIFKAHAKMTLNFDAKSRIIDLLSGIYEKEIRVNTLPDNDKYINSEVMFKRLSTLYSEVQHDINMLCATRLLGGRDQN